MTEIEQLRKEVNELRERVAVLERQTLQRQPIAPNGFWPRRNEITCVSRTESGLL